MNEDTGGLTWQRKKGENPQRDHTQLSKRIFYSDDVDHDLLRHVWTPKDHETKLRTKPGGKTNYFFSPHHNKTMLPGSLDLVASLNQEVLD